MTGEWLLALIRARKSLAGEKSGVSEERPSRCPMPLMHYWAANLALVTAASPLDASNHDPPTTPSIFPLPV